MYIKLSAMAYPFMSLRKKNILTYNRENILYLNETIGCFRINTIQGLFEVYKLTDNNIVDLHIKYNMKLKQDTLTSL